MSPRRIAVDVKRVVSAVADARQTTIKAGELGIAAGTVVAQRMALGFAAFSNPGEAGYHEFGHEFGRMVPEKVEAFSAAGSIMVERSAAIGEQMVRFALNEARHATLAAADVATSRTPAELVGAQSRFVLGFAERMASLTIRLGTMSLAIGGAVLTPVHRTARENSERLR